MFYGSLHMVPGHSSPKPFRPGTYCFALCLDPSLLLLEYIVWFGNSLADYITKLLVGQECLLRLGGRVDASLVTLFDDFPAFQ